MVVKGYIDRSEGPGLGVNPDEASFSKAMPRFLIRIHPNQTRFLRASRS